jgi:hypothetical protein
METKFAPYAPPSSVLNIIRHYRSKDVPEKVTVTNLMQIGVTEALANRTMAALRFLGLVREDDTTTDEFRSLRYATDDQYQEVLGGIVNAAYKDVLDHVNLESADERALNSAFIPYSPGGQRSRMITLFLALAMEAGWTLLAPAKQSSPRAAKATPSKNAAKLRGTAKPIEQKPEQAPSPVNTEGVVAFGVTDSDLAALPDDEFDDVWAALGKLARARAKAARPEETPAKETAGD